MNKISQPLHSLRQGVPPCWLRISFSVISLKRFLMMKEKSKLIFVKLLHTAVWAIFASSIFAIPVCAFLGKLALAWCLIGFVLIEVIVLLANHMRCPLTNIAGRYTAAREDNFDIYLPLWLARNNKVIFGVLYIVAILYVVFGTR
jgi:hypothetical protein